MIYDRQVPSDVKQYFLRRSVIYGKLYASVVNETYSKVTINNILKNLRIISRVTYFRVICPLSLVKLISKLLRIIISRATCFKISTNNILRDLRVTSHAPNP